MKILLPIDSSPYSEIAINQVIARPWPADAQVCVFSVVDVTRFGVIGTEGGQWTAALSEAAERSVKTAAEKLKSAGLSAQGIVTLGSPGPSILEYAKDWGANFIFVGSHGRTAFTRLFLGSVSRAVIHRAPCSVVIARAPEKTSATQGFRILIATDGSDCSLGAVRSVAERKWPDAASILLLSVGEVPDLSMSPERIDAETIDRMTDAANSAASEAVAAARKALAATGIQVTDRVVIGDPKSVILDEAERIGADLIVVGSHGRTGINRILLGSVSEAVAIGAHCSVEVIR